MAKTLFDDTPPQGTIVTAAFSNAMNNQRHTGRDIDGEGALDYAVSTGGGDAYEVALVPALDAYIPGMPVIFKASFANTGAATLTLTGLTAKPLKKPDGSDLAPGDILIGQMVVAIYDGANFQVIGLITVPSAGVPVGAEIYWPTETPPAGWLEENGAELARATYADLFILLGTMYGNGNGTTTFNLPDERGRFPRVWDHGAGIDPDRAARTNRGDGTTGDHVGTKQTDAFEIHTHNVGGNTGYQIMNNQHYAGSTPSEVSSATGGNETRPVNTNRMLIIKY